MIIAYIVRKTLEPREIAAGNSDFLKEAVWVDLISPSIEEEKLVEQVMNLGIPSRAEMAEIETSSRLYKEHNTLFMTAAMIAQGDTSEPKLDPITFVLTDKQLVTIRYIEPQAFKTFSAHLYKLESSEQNAFHLFIGLLDASIDRLADLLELVGHRLDAYSKTIFRPTDDTSEKIDYKKLMQEIGANGDLTTKARESLINLNRLVAFFGQTTIAKTGTEEHPHVATQSKDIVALSDHAHFLSSKISFLLDATLGMVNIEQNNIIKIFSVAAVIFLPPTLIASIYGMNFHIPELSWKFGYGYSLVLMVLAALLPFRYAKYKKWL
ncbi:MAG TPA: magnesium transporter CorA family protein [Gammaproteobacteria bacterium]|nr:magnesium transporter CorA family protein [Gammaproteobacteria bacterium]